MATIEDKIGYNFKNKAYLMEALTHSSFANEGIIKLSVTREWNF